MWIFGPIPMFACSLLMVVILHMLDTNSLPLHQHQFTVRKRHEQQRGFTPATIAARHPSPQNPILSNPVLSPVTFFSWWWQCLLQNLNASVNLQYMNIEVQNFHYKYCFPRKMLHIELWIKDWDHDTSVKYSLKVSWSDTNLSQSYSRIYHIHTPLSEWKTSREMVHTGSDVL